MMHPQVKAFFEMITTWNDELQLFRAIALECGLEEDYKWKHPCYTYRGKNIVILGGFKGYCAMLFFNGALLKDTEQILVQPTENSQAGRQIRVTSTDEINQLRPHIKAYLFEAIEAEKAGVKVEYKKTQAFDVPEELQHKLDTDADFKAAFEGLTPGRQRGYLLHFAQPKQSATRAARIEKATSRILNGKGLNDCICGHSKRFPNCDGSHKHYE